MMTLTPTDARSFFENESENSAIQILAAKKFLSLFLIKINERNIACFGINNRTDEFCFAVLYIFEEIDQQMQDQISQLIRTEVKEKFIALKILNDTFAPKLIWESNIVKDEHWSYVYYKNRTEFPIKKLDKKYIYYSNENCQTKESLQLFFKKAFGKETVATTEDFIKDFWELEVAKQIDTIYSQHELVACLLHCTFMPNVRYIFLIGTHPDFLQKGLATFLLQKLLSTANETQFTLGVYKNAKAKKLYENLGFELAKRNNYLL